MLAGGEGQDKPRGWLRLLAALYYCGASMLVQSVNKARLRAFCTGSWQTQQARCSMHVWAALPVLMEDPHRQPRIACVQQAAVPAPQGTRHEAGLPQALFTTLGFHFPLLVASLQMLVIAPVCYAVARPRLSWDTIQTVLPLALVNVLNVVCGLVGGAPRLVTACLVARRCSGVMDPRGMHRRLHRCVVQPWPHSPCTWSLRRLSVRTGTGGLNIPMFIALRRFTLVCTIVLERFMLNKIHDRATVGAIAVMVGGTSTHCAASAARPS